MQRVKRVKRVVRTNVMTLVISAVVAAGALVAVGLNQSPASATLTSGFNITAAIYASPACSGSPALLYPGTTRCTVFTITNSLNATITVQSLTTTLDPAYTIPAGCSGSDLILPNYSGSFNVAGHGGTANSPGVPISLKDNGNQNACKNVTFHFVYSGSAIYTEVYGTSTVITSSSNPSTVGQSVTYTATVTAKAASGQDPVPSSPTGTVTFYDGAVTPANVIPGCNNVPLPASTQNVATATANCTSPAYGSSGTHSITAVYSNTDGNFSTSTSSALVQAVQASNCLNLSATGATVITGTYSGSYEVKNGTTLWLKGGTITGTVTVDATGTFVATGGSVGRNLSSLGGAVSLQSTSVGGNVQTTNAAFGLGAGTQVTGNLQVTGGSTLCSAGTTPSPVHVGGNVAVQSLASSAGPVHFCNTQIGGNFTWQSNAAALVMGGSAVCVGNATSGNFTVQSNSGQVTIGQTSGSAFGNTVQQKLIVGSNTGGGTLAFNTAVVSCSLSGDKPGIVGTGNTAPSGKNTCNATA